jgi:hypothetical protein
LLSDLQIVITKPREGTQKIDEQAKNRHGASGNSISGELPGPTLLISGCGT